MRAYDGGRATAANFGGRGCRRRERCARGSLGGAVRGYCRRETCCVGDEPAAFFGARRCFDWRFAVEVDEEWGDEAGFDSALVGAYTYSGWAGDAYSDIGIKDRAHRDRCRSWRA